MKTKRNGRVRCAAALLGGGMLLASGNCVPDNFWMNTWAGALDDVADAVVAVYIVEPMTEALVPAEEE